MWIKLNQYLQNVINAIENNSNDSKNIDIADDNGSIGINIVFISVCDYNVNFELNSFNFIVKSVFIDLNDINVQIVLT